MIVSSLYLQHVIEQIKQGKSYDDVVESSHISVFKCYYTRFTVNTQSNVHYYRKLRLDKIPQN